VVVRGIQDWQNSKGKSLLNFLMERSESVASAQRDLPEQISSGSPDIGATVFLSPSAPPLSPY
jgi:hypothetical protein